MKKTRVIGEIIDFELYFVNNEAISVSLEIKTNDAYHEFGGANLFESIPNSGPDLAGHFIRRCFQVCEATKGRELIDHLVKVEFDNDQIVGIASLRSDDFFYPAIEFEKLARGEEYL